MSKPLPLPPSDSERITPEYSRLLAEAVQSAGLTVAELVGRGYSKQVVWRVLHHRGRPSINAAERVRQRIMKLRPGVVLPPPAVPVSGVKHHEAIELCSALIALDVNAFDRLMDLGRSMVEAALTVQKLQAEVERNAGGSGLKRP